MRMIYVDALRGAAMLMVVYSHVLTFGMGGITPSPIGLYMRDIMLPLFFFISGFCAYSSKNIDTVNTLLNGIIKKTKAVLIPTIVMFTIFMVYSRNEFFTYAMSYDKSGYWFTWVLFQIFVIFLTTRYVADRFAVRQWIRIIIMLTPLVIMYVVFSLIGFRSGIAIIFEWIKVKGFYLYFLLGYFLRLFLPKFQRLCTNQYFVSILLVSSIAEYKFYRGGGNILIINIITIFYIFEKLFNTSNLMSNALSLIGKNSLAVYFLHFFLLFRLPSSVTKYITYLHTDTCFGSNSCASIVEFAISGGIAITISYACLCIQRILRQFPIAYKLCFGPIK